MSQQPDTTGEEASSLRSNWDFLRLLIGRFVTNAGDSLYTIAGTWLVYDLTGSSFYTGLAGALLLLPPGLQFMAGPLVDRWSLTRILVCVVSRQCQRTVALEPRVGWGAR